jgi:predicted transcriptional regulator/ribosomal protein S18 acetylase RimI-like enzyme
MSPASNPILIRRATPDDYSAIQEFLVESGGIYPGIVEWWRRRVIPEDGTLRRVLLVADSGDTIEGLFIGKAGEHAKLCTLRLREGIRRQGVGSSLVVEGFRHLLSAETTDVHVTVSEGAEPECVPFFESIGFRRTAVLPDRYVKGLDEFVYGCSVGELSAYLDERTPSVLEHTLFGAIPGAQEERRQGANILMSLQPRYADLFLKGKKTVEFRRRFSRKYRGSRIIFYVSSPVRTLLFSALIAEVEQAHTAKLWSSYGDSGGISRQEFDHYFTGREYGYAISLSDVEVLRAQVTLDQIRTVCPGLRPPQSFQLIPPNSRLLHAVEPRY